MKIDLAKSGSYTRRQNSALRQGNLRRAAALNRARRRVDDRFDPAQGARRHRPLPQARQGALRPRGPRARLLPHGHGQPGERPEATSAAGRRPYAELYFASTPLRHAAAYRRLASLGDDSSNYFWKLNAAAAIMRAYRRNPPTLVPRGGRDALLRDAPQGDLRPLAGARRGHRADRRAEAASCAPKRSPRRSTWPPRCGRSPTRRRCGSSHADDGGWTFRVSRKLRLGTPGARVPVRSGSPAGPQRDRVVAHGQHDPRHRRARRGGAGAAARPARRETTVTDAIRTPDVLLDGLPGFEWAPSFRTWDGLRLAHVDVGDGAPVVMLHGEPTWSYLWRKVAPPVLEAGPPRDPARPARLRALGQADGRGLVLLRPPHGGDQGPRRVAGSARRHVRPARLGRADRAAGRGRARRARVAVRADGHRPVHRQRADERRLAPLRGLRRPRRRAARRAGRAARLRHRSRATRSPPPTTRRSRTR